MPSDLKENITNEKCISVVESGPNIEALGTLPISGEVELVAFRKSFVEASKGGLLCGC